MNYAQYTITCTFETEALLPRHKGSALRGLFGHCLKKVACALRQNRCEECLLNSTCVYFQVFESPRAQGQSRQRTNVRPHPFVLEPPMDTKKRNYAPGDSFTMVFKLFGPGIDWLPYIVYCVENMGRTGLGARSRHGWGRFRLDSVSCGTTEIYSGETKTLEQNGCRQRLGIENIEPEQVDTADVWFASPLRLKSGNRLTDSIDFQTLIRACCRRIATLEDAFGNGEPTLDYQGLVKKAGAVRTVSSDWRWERVFRYSSRQKTKMNIGGITGRARYRGDITPFWPLLKYCEAVHIGKQTAFGNGKIVVMAA
ncbi:CRISPR system precrRNA processing endoribonuclease RAMP protein Cas6 [Desulfolithobacter sp.]